MGLSVDADMELEELGVVCAFAIKDGEARHVGARDDEPADFRWHHINLSVEPGRRWLTRNSGLPAQLATNFANRALDVGAYNFGSGLLLVLEDRLEKLGDKSVDSRDLSEMHIWVDPGRVITGRWQALAATNRLRFRFEKGKAPDGPMALALDLIGEVVTDVETINNRCEDDLDALEDEILGDGTQGVAADLGTLRREFSILRRRLLPLRKTLDAIAAAGVTWLRPEDRERISALANRIDRELAEIGAAQEQARLLQEESNARLAERSGRNIYVLSVLTAVLLPLNLITGIFGMNVAGLPGLHDHSAFFWVMVSMVAIGVAMLALFKVSRWF